MDRLEIKENSREEKSLEKSIKSRYCAQSELPFVIWMVTRRRTGALGNSNVTLGAFGNSNITLCKVKDTTYTRDQTSP